MGRTAVPECEGTLHWSVIMSRSPYCNRMSSIESIIDTRYYLLSAHDKN